MCRSTASIPDSHPAVSTSTLGPDPSRRRDTSARTRSGRRAPLIFVAASALAMLFLAQPETASAQATSVSWTEVSRIQMPGSLGAFLQAMPGGMDSRSTPQAIHIMGNRLRHDHGNTSTIMDLDEGRWLTVNHDDQSYVEIRQEDIGEIARAFAELSDEIQQDMQEMTDELTREFQEERDEAMEQMRQAMDEASAAMEFRLDARSTGERTNIEGFAAERHIVTVEVDVQDEVQGVEDVEGGTLVFLVELWQSNDFPSAEQLQEEWGQRMADDPELQALGRELAESLEPIAGGMGPEALAMWDPRIAGGLDHLADVLESLEGTTLRSVTNVALVPSGETLDEAALLAWEPDSMGDRLQATAGGAARGAAQDAARGAIRGLTGGLFGGGGNDEPDEVEEEEGGVRPILRVVREVVDVQQTDATADLFEPGAGYTALRLFDLEQMFQQLDPDAQPDMD